MTVRPREIEQGAGAAALQASLRQIGSIVLGKERQVRLALACLLARGHLLIEDLPGVGKTTLAQTLARALGLEFRRLQFTSDLLPADVVGVNVFERTADGSSGAFVFQPGPVFTQLVLADEINRASPKTQSALLEAMEEERVTVDGVTRPLPQPFFVIATQNPQYQIGTFPLPESQLDRFVMRIALGYPPSSAEHALIQGRDRRDLLHELRPALDPERLRSLQRQASEIHVSGALVEYILALLRHSRENRHYGDGLSPRAGIALKRSAQAWALLDGRDGVLPEDVQAVLVPVCAHRLHPPDTGSDTRELARQLLADVPIP